MELNLKTIYLMIIYFTAFQRLFELLVSKRNEKFILKNKGFIVPERNYIFMVLLHSLWIGTFIYFSFSSLVVANDLLFWLAFCLFFLGQALRLTAIKTLGKRWTTRIAILPGKIAVSNGIFSKIRHPNYLGVCLEIMALPLMGGYVDLAIFFSIINLLILFFRIRKEEFFLRKYNSYGEVF